MPALAALAACRRSVTGAALIASVTLSPGGLLAAVIQVPGQHTTIQSGIAAAAPGDTVLVANGTYTGAGNRDLSFGGKNIVVRSAGGPASCFIDAGNAGRGFVFTGAEPPSARLEGFTITRGFHASAGGGIYVSGSNVTIADCIVVNNGTGQGAAGTSGVPGGDGGDGGGAYVTSGAPTFLRCTIDANHTGAGGAGYVSASGPGGSSGGHGGSGGGIHVGLGCAVKLTNCIVTGNTSGAGGQGGSSVVCVPPLGCQTFGENGGRGGDGAGLYNESMVEAVNCLFAGNQTGQGGAAGFGSGLPLPSPGRGGDGAAWHGGLVDSKVVNCTVAANLAAPAGPAGQPAGTGGGILGSPTVVNSILWGNNSTAVGPLAQVTYSDIEGGFAGTGNLAVDPLFVAPLGGNFRLQTFSPCVDAGNNVAVPVGSTTDLDGHPRIVDGNLNGTAEVDMGAYDMDPKTSGTGAEWMVPTAIVAAFEPANGGPVRVHYRIGPLGATARLDVYDVTGRHVAVLAQEWHAAGEYTRRWERRTAAGTPAARGIYFVHLSAAGVQDTKKLLLLRR